MTCGFVHMRTREKSKSGAHYPAAHLVGLGLRRADNGSTDRAGNAQGDSGDDGKLHNGNVVRALRLVKPCCGRLGRSSFIFWVLRSVIRRIRWCSSFVGPLHRLQPKPMWVDGIITVIMARRGGLALTTSLVRRHTGASAARSFSAVPDEEPAEPERAGYPKLDRAAPSSAVTLTLLILTRH